MANTDSAGAKEMSVSEAQVELGLGFSAKGSVFIASGTDSASLKVTLTLQPKPEDQA